MAQKLKRQESLPNTMQHFLCSSNFMIWFILFCLFCVVIYVLRSVLLPFVLGIILGYLFDPLVSKFQKLKISRTAATLLAFLCVILAVVPLIAVFIGVVNQELSVFIKATPDYMASLFKKTEPFLRHLQNYFPTLQADNIKAIMAQNTAQVFQFGGKFLQGLFQNGMAVVNVLSLLLITPVVAFYMLRDWDVFAKKADSLLPRKSKKTIRRICKQIDKALSGFIRGQLSVCLILGIYYALSLKMVGLKFGALVGFVAGLISFMPYVGSITGFVLSMVLAFSEFNSWTHILAVIAVFIVGQFLEGNFLTPKLVGDKVGLHPVWVMFSLLAGGVLLGFLGLMIAVPVAAVIGILIREAVAKYQASNLYLEN